MQSKKENRDDIESYSNSRKSLYEDNEKISGMIPPIHNNSNKATFYQNNSPLSNSTYSNYQNQAGQNSNNKKKQQAQPLLFPKIG